MTYPSLPSRRRLALAAGLALAGLAVAYGQTTPGTAFSPNVRVFDTTTAAAQTGAEPSIALDADDNVYVATTGGGGRLWRSLSGGATWKFLGGVSVGGNDEDLEFDALNRLYYSDLVVVRALASTVTRFTNPAAITSAAQRDFQTTTQPLQDRQWLATFGEETVYLAFHDVGPEWVWLSPSFDGGATFLPAVPAINDPVLLLTTIPNTNDGRVHTDKRTGAVYITFAASTPEDNASKPPFGPHRKIALSRSFDGGLMWQNFTVFEGPPGTATGNLFPGFAIDRSGNLYVIFAANLDAGLQLTPDGTLNVFYTRSIDRGRTWSHPLRVNTDDLRSNVQPWAVAGCAGKVDIVWYGTDASGNPNFFPPSGDGAPDWHVYLAQTLGGLGDAPTFAVTRVSDHVIHKGQISTGGLIGNADRRLLDFFEVDHDRAGMARVVWADTGTSATTAAVPFYARQTAGEGILGCAAPVNEVDVSGGGFIRVLDAKNSFGFNADAENPLVGEGGLGYVDRGPSPFRFSATRISAVELSGNRATIAGEGLVDGVRPTSFLVQVTDNGELGSSDVFSITLGTGYTASGTLGGGNIHVRQ
jgi:hypothetical protein